MATFQIKIQQSGRTAMAESVALPAVSSVETSLKQRQQRTTKSNRRQRRRQQTAQQQQLTAATFDPPTAKNVNESLTSNLLSFNLPSSNGNSNSNSNNNNNGNRNGNKSQQDIDTFNLLNGSRQRQRQRHRSSVVATGDAPNRLQDSTYAGNSNNTCSSCCCKLNTIKSNSSLNTNSTPLTTFCNARIFRLDAAASLIMLTMLVVVTLVISGNGVLAAQRDVFKAKDNVNANALQNNGLADSSAVGASSGFNVNGNMPSNGNNKNSSIPTGAATSTITSFTSIATSTLKAPSTAIHSNGDGNGNGNDNGTLTTSVTTATTSTSTTSSTTTTTTTTGHSIASSSLQKVSSNSPSGTSGINRNTIELVDDTRNGPYFDKAASKNVTALLGKTAYLNCRVKNLGNKTMLLQVSWVRHRDIHLLTVGRYTYTSDQRFRAIHQPQTEDWILQIKYPQHRDSGVYECQVSTTPHMSHYIHLNVVEPSTEIIGAPDLYIESGSTINLTCVILNSPEPPAYIFWNHNNAIINYDSPRGGVSVVTNKGETTTSFLLIKSARPSDSGLYQCNPSNAKPKSVTVHVLNGVSHSVSRGVPSSNAARGTSASSHVSKSLSVSVPVCVLLQFSVCQSLYAAAVTGAATAWRRSGNWWHANQHVGGYATYILKRILSALAMWAYALYGLANVTANNANKRRRRLRLRSQKMCNAVLLLRHNANTTTVTSTNELQPLQQQSKALQQQQQHWPRLVESDIR